MAGKIRHLVDHHGKYYARLAVPKNLRDAVGKRELWEVLDADRRIALQLLPGVLARLQNTLEAAKIQAGLATRSRTLPSKGRPLNARQVAQAHYDLELGMDEAARNTGNHSADTGQFNSAYREKLKLVASGIEANVDAIGAAIGWALDAFQKRGHINLERGSTEWRTLARTLASVQLEAISRVTERDQGDFTGKPSLPILMEQPSQPTDPLAARILGPESLLSLTELVPRFLAERKISSSSQHEHVVSARMIQEHFGEARPVYKITRRDVISYKNALLDLPSNYIKRFPGMTLPQAIKANKDRATPYPLLDPRTVNDKWLSSLRALLNWCVQNDIIPDNPANGVKSTYQVEKGKPSRVNFDPGDLTKIFSKPLFDQAKPWGETQWCYLLSLYCGTRPSELAQVKLDSIRHERGVLVMRVQEETKNVGSQRAIPIHSELIRLGLMKRVEKLRSKGQVHLFPEWYADGTKALAALESKSQAIGTPVSLDKHFPKFIPRRFNVTYRKRIGIHDERKVFYSFRHTFKTGLAQAGVSKDVRDALAGHRDQSPGEGYIHDVSLESLSAAIEKLRFDGIELR